jgi:hypothetical protein
MLTSWWNAEPGVGVPPARRQATAIYAARADARARIAKASPTLQHSESWFETLVSLHEYLPPGIWWFVNALTSVITLLDIWFSGDGAGFDGDTWWRIPSYAHNTLLGLLSLLLAFRTAQAYDRWWEARKLWGQVRWQATMAVLICGTRRNLFPSRPPLPHGHAVPHPSPGFALPS